MRWEWHSCWLLCSANTSSSPKVVNLIGIATAISFIDWMFARHSTSPTKLVRPWLAYCSNCPTLPWLHLSRSMIAFLKKSSSTASYPWTSAWTMSFVFRLTSLSDVQCQARICSIPGTLTNPSIPVVWVVLIYPPRSTYCATRKE